MRVESRRILPGIRNTRRRERVCWVRDGSGLMPRQNHPRGLNMGFKRGERGTTGTDTQP